MNPDYKPLLKWFGYSRRERRSTFILLITIVLVIALRYLLPEKNIDVEDISASLTPLSGTPTYSNQISGDTLRSFINYSEKGRAATLKNSRLSDSGPGSVRIKRIDLNNCDSVLLDKLPGIGPVLSVRIIKYRNLLGGFVSAEQLKEVYGLSEETFTRIAKRVFADSTAVKQININMAGLKDLIRHPYFERYDVQSILKYRELRGSITSLGELTDNKILTTEKAKRIGPYLNFSK